MADPTLEKSAVLYANRGTSVVVYSGRFKGLPAAIKERMHESLDQANSALREAFSQIQLDHQGICKVYDCFLETSDTGEIRSVIVTELMQRDLYEEILQRAQQGAFWSEAELVTILRNLTEVLVYAQSRLVSHRDIKPQNIFIRDGEIKIGDFGSSSSNNKDAIAFSIQGSPFFLSPELKLMYMQMLQEAAPNVSYDPYKSDVYSLGVTVLFMARLKTPSELANLGNLREATEGLLADCGNYPNLSPILREMLEIKPEDRIDFSKLYSLLAFDPPTLNPQPVPDLSTCPDCGLFQLPRDSDVPSASLEFCVCPRAPLCPDCGQALLRNAAGALQGCNCALQCMLCQQAVESMEWSEKLPESFKGLVCSHSCLERLCREQELQFCVGCEVVCDLGPELECGHIFHDYSCFYYFLLSVAQSANNTSARCTRCNRPVSSEVLKQHFCKANLPALKTISSHSICVRCLAGIGLVPEPDSPPDSGRFICVECFDPPDNLKCPLL